MIDFEKENFSKYEEDFSLLHYNPEDTLVLTLPKGEYIDWIKEQMGTMLTREISNAILKEP